MTFFGGKYFFLIISCLALACPGYGNQNYSCGTRLDLDSNDPNDSRTPGFLSGYYLDGLEVYPGTGVFPSCGNSDRPGRISARKNLTAIHTPCGIEPGNNLISYKQTKYFVATPNLKWTKTDYSNLRQVPGAVKINNYLFFRVNFKFNGEEYQTIGLHHNDWYSCPVYYWNEKETIAIESGEVEILTCD